MATATQTSILVIDDDDHFRETMSDAMSLKDVVVAGAMSRAAALRELETATPSLILLDVQLPDVHGFQFCRELRKNPRLKNVPVVLLSAKYTEPADRAEGLLTGADAYLSKPINLETLWEEVCYLLDNVR
jgi:twitching motility two-component system response regulator PilH